jgi:EH_Signature domain
MSVFETLAKLGLPHRSRLSEPTALATACNIISQRWPDITIPQSAELTQLATEYENRVARSDWSNSLQRDVATLMRATSSGRLAAYPQLAEFLMREAAVTSSKSLLAALCEGYLDGWRPGSTLTKNIASAISKRIPDMPARWSRLFDDCPELGDWEIGHTKLADRMTQSEDPYSWLLDRGFRTPHGLGFSAAVQDEFLNVLPRLTEQRDAEQLMHWVVPKTGLKLEGEALVRCLRMLLDPWIMDVPTDNLKRRLIDWLVRNFGDPRFQQPEIWNRIGQDYRAVMMRWLAGDSIRAFMDIISAVEPRETWRKRRVFWMSLFEAKVIEEAWVALHPFAATLAERKYAETGDASFKAYGKQNGSRKKDTSLLIMRAGNRLIVEGSQNYRVHVFDEGFPGRPRLYEPEYRDEEITLPGDDKHNTNWHDTADHWCNWVKRRLR